MRRKWPFSSLLVTLPIALPAGCPDKGEERWKSFLPPSAASEERGWRIWVLLWLPVRAAITIKRLGSILLLTLFLEIF